MVVQTYTTCDVVSDHVECRTSEKNETLVVTNMTKSQNCRTPFRLPYNRESTSSSLRFRQIDTLIAFPCNVQTNIWEPWEEATRIEAMQEATNGVWLSWSPRSHSTPFWFWEWIWLTCVDIFRTLGLSSLLWHHAPKITPSFSSTTQTHRHCQLRLLLLLQPLLQHRILLRILQRLRRYHHHQHHHQNQHTVPII